MAWRVARSIAALHGQLRPFAPRAPAVAFGTIADAAHPATSDHAAKVLPGLGPVPVVTAGDFPHAERLDAGAVLDSIRRSRDDRVKYAIWAGQMYSSYPAHGYAAFEWRPYSGKDGHFTHGHMSVVGDGRADDPRPWTISRGDAVALTAQDLIAIWTHDLQDGPGVKQAYHLLLETRDQVQGVAAEVADIRDRPPVTLTPEQFAELGDRVAAAVVANPAIAEAIAQRTAALVVDALGRTRLAVAPPGAV